MASDDRSGPSAEVFRRARQLSEETERLAKLGHWEWTGSPSDISRPKIRDVEVLLMSGFPVRMRDDPDAWQTRAPILRKPFTKLDLALAVRRRLDGGCVSPGERG